MWDLGTMHFDSAQSRLAVYNTICYCTAESLVDKSDQKELM